MNSSVTKKLFNKSFKFSVKKTVLDTTSHNANKNISLSREKFHTVSTFSIVIISMNYLCAQTGSIPTFYREVYEKICSPTSGNVEREVFKSLLVKSQLNSSYLSQVSRLVSLLHELLSSKHETVKTTQFIVKKISNNNYDVRDNDSME